MRIPILIVIPLSLAVIATVWWAGTRDKDFMTPPTEEKLAEIRQKVEASLVKPPTRDEIPVVSQPGGQQTPPAEPAPVEPPKPAIDPGNLAAPAKLDTYADQAFKGGEYLIELASFLENEGHIVRAALAWERILDSTKPTAEQTRSATNAMKRLKPRMAAWNDDPATAHTIVIQAGTGRKVVKRLKPILEQAAKDIEKSSSGLLKVKTNITVGKGQTFNDAAPPIALWFSGGAKDAPATEVISFTAGEKEDLDALTNQTLYNVLRAYFTRSTLTPPSPAASDEPFQESLEKRVTRLSWDRLGTTLNPQPTANP
ncbi:MAG: hypothetical protein QM627_04395 [Luteolibacter sp.]